MGRGTGSLGGAPPRAEQRGTARSPAGSSRSHTNSVHRSAPARKPLGGLRAGVLRRGYDGGARHEARQDRRARGAAGDLAYLGDALQGDARDAARDRSEEHTSELQSQSNLVCRLLLEKKKKKQKNKERIAVTRRID